MSDDRLKAIEILVKATLLQPQKLLGSKIWGLYIVINQMKSY